MPRVAKDESNDDVTDTRRASWPAGQIPVEIFNIIATYITRAEAKALRLVCREFELKTSAQYFRNVVLPFRSELYSSVPRDDTGIPQHPSSILFSSGMRMFESFGPHIVRFALSLEIDEDELAYPPIKPAQEAVPCFWGIYRWPHKNYNRYLDMETTEKTADKTQTMRKALRCLPKINNLGLCCDAGLGFLVRPDTVARNATSKPNVFSTHGWRQEQPAVSVSDFDSLEQRGKKHSPDSVGFKRTVLEKMAVNAGYRGNETEEVIKLLLDTEETDLFRIEFDPLETNAEMHFDDLESEAGLSTLETTLEPPNVPLRPAALTQAQKELLLELDWVHRAMIQSYVVSMIDNAHAGCFDNLTTLTIAKIPSSLVHLLYRTDLWNSFPNLAKVFLGVIADWRQISKGDPVHIEDNAVSPVRAVSKVHTLLNSFIGKQPKIESLHFEWICGGEFSPSVFQRNRYILPAPFLEKPDGMASLNGAKTDKEQLLTLPYIKHLSLKNCWVSPHVFLQMIREMGLKSLEKLELESVSLSGRPTSEYQLPLGQAAWQIQTGANIDSSDDSLPSPSSHSTGMSLPELFTWAGMLEHFSPGPNTRKQMIDQEDVMATVQRSWESTFRAARNYLPDVNRLAEDEKEYRIKWLSLKSCGYVAINIDTLDTRALFPSQLSSTGMPTLNARQKAIQSTMQGFKDALLGRIIPIISEEETAQLTDVFHMTMGWSGIYSEKLIGEATADGFQHPGAGRFSGTVKY